jgi:hypothetical protein
LTQVLLYQNQALSVSGKPVMDPLPTIVVLPMPLIAILGICFVQFAKYSAVYLKYSILVVLKGSVLAKPGTKSKMSLNPKLLSFKVVFILNSSTVSLIAAIDG